MDIYGGWIKFFDEQWEMPEEYELYEQGIDKKEQQQLPEVYEAQLL